jgi:hypothetical protein
VYLQLLGYAQALPCDFEKLDPVQMDEWRKQSPRLSLDHMTQLMSQFEGWMKEKYKESVFSRVTSARLLSMSDSLQGDTVPRLDTICKTPTDTAFLAKVNEYVGKVPKVKMSYVVVMCQHCEEAPASML